MIPVSRTKLATENNDQNQTKGIWV